MDKIRVYAFVGPSGTGKSYRAQMVAGQNNISYIIDDGLLINENEVVAGESAKKAPTKIETVRHAVFIDEKDRKEMVKAIKKYKPAMGIRVYHLKEDIFTIPLYISEEFKDLNYKLYFRINANSRGILDMTLYAI